MKFRFDHNNINVKDLQKSVNFYRDALGLVEIRRKEAESFILVFLGDEKTGHKLELTWLRDRAEPYNWETTNSTWLWSSTTMPLPSSITRRWAACAMRIPPWASTSSRIPTGIGWKSFPRRSDRRTIPVQVSGYRSQVTN